MPYLTRSQKKRFSLPISIDFLNATADHEEIETDPFIEIPETNFSSNNDFMDYQDSKLGAKEKSENCPADMNIEDEVNSRYDEEITSEIHHFVQMPEISVVPYDFRSNEVVNNPYTVAIINGAVQIKEEIDVAQTEYFEAVFLGVDSDNVDILPETSESLFPEQDSPTVNPEILLCESCRKFFERNCEYQNNTRILCNVCCDNLVFSDQNYSGKFCCEPYSSSLFNHELSELKYNIKRDHNYCYSSKTTESCDNLVSRDQNYPGKFCSCPLFNHDLSELKYNIEHDHNYCNSSKTTENISHLNNFIHICSLSQKDCSIQCNVQHQKSSTSEKINPDYFTCESQSVANTLKTNNEQSSTKTPIQKFVKIVSSGMPNQATIMKDSENAVELQESSDVLRNYLLQSNTNLKHSFLKNFTILNCAEEKCAEKGEYSQVTDNLREINLNVEDENEHPSVSKENSCESNISPSSENLFCLEKFDESLLISASEWTSDVIIPSLIDGANIDINKSVGSPRSIENSTPNTTNEGPITPVSSSPVDMNVQFENLLQEFNSFNKNVESSSAHVNRTSVINNGSFGIQNKFRKITVVKGKSSLSSSNVNKCHMQSSSANVSERTVEKFQNLSKSISTMLENRLGILLCYFCLKAMPSQPELTKHTALCNKRNEKSSANAKNVTAIVCKILVADDNQKGENSSNVRIYKLQSISYPEFMDTAIQSIEPSHPTPLWPDEDIPLETQLIEERTEINASESTVLPLCKLCGKLLKRGESLIIHEKYVCAKRSRPTISCGNSIKNLLSILKYKKL